jgi:hypothetical protein
MHRNVTIIRTLPAMLPSSLDKSECLALCYGHFNHRKRLAGIYSVGGVQFLCLLLHSFEILSKTRVLCFLNAKRINIVKPPRIQDTNI